MNWQEKLSELGASLDDGGEELTRIRETITKVLTHLEEQGRVLAQLQHFDQEIEQLVHNLRERIEVLEGEETSDNSSESSPSSSSSSSKSSPSSSSSDSSRSSASSRSSESSGSSESEASSQSSKSSRSSESSSVSSSRSSASSSSSSTRITPIPPPGNSWMGFGYDPTTNRTKLKTDGATSLVTSPTAFEAALNTARNGGLDCIQVRYGPNYGWPHSRVLSPYDRSVFGKDPVRDPLIIMAEPGSAQRPRLGEIFMDNAFAGAGPMRGIVFKGFDLRGTNLLMTHAIGGQDVLFEDCVFDHEMKCQPRPEANLMQTDMQNFCIRYCFWDKVGGASRISSAFLRNTQLKMEYTTVWHGGWLNSRESEANLFSHNLYIQKTPNQSNRGTSIIRYNIIADASSHGIHCRPGGIVEDNFFLANPINLQCGYEFNDVYGKWYSTGSIRRNVIIESADINSGNPRGYGIWLRAVRDLQVEDNIICFNNTSTPNNIAIWLEGPEAFDRSVVIRRNISHSWGHGLLGGNYPSQCTVEDNHFDDGTVYKNPNVALNFRSSIVIPQVIANNFVFSKAWIEGALNAVRSGFQVA